LGRLPRWGPAPDAQVVEGALEFARAFRRAHGFAPGGFATYFVHREGARTRLTAGAYRCARAALPGPLRRPRWLPCAG